MNIFISYRRDDTAGSVGRLYDGLRAHYASESLFMDVDHIAPGADFVEALESAVARCDVMLAVIGRSWTTVTSPNGKPRLDDPEDFVRIEVASALGRRSEITIIPVLVDNARPLSSADLPEPLAPLARLQVAMLRHETWSDDLGRLVHQLQKIETRLAGAPAAVAPAATPPVAKRPPVVEPPPDPRRQPTPDPVVEEQRERSPDMYVPESHGGRTAVRLPALAAAAAALLLLALGARALMHRGRGAPASAVTTADTAKRQAAAGDSGTRAVAADSIFRARDSAARTSSATSGTVPVVKVRTPSALNAARTRALNAARAQWRSDARIVRAALTWAHPDSAPRIEWVAVSRAAGKMVTIDFANSANFTHTEQAASPTIAALPALPDTFVELTVVVLAAHNAHVIGAISSAQLEVSANNGPVWYLWPENTFEGSLIYSAFTADRIRNNPP